MEKEIRRHFSKIGFAYLAGSIVIYAVQFLAAMVGKKFVPAKDPQLTQTQLFL